MRDIRFRGKAYAMGEWIYGSLIHHQNGTMDIFNDRIGDYRDMIVNNSTVGQYTGLKDVDSKEIYEGDVLKHMSSNFFGVVKWHKNGYFYIKDTDSEDSHRPLGEMLQVEDFVIIGNIHDNPEITTKRNNNGRTTFYV